MGIYGRKLLYMCILASVYAHLRKPKYTYMKNKGGKTWEHAQVVDPYALGSMGALERLDDPINTPMGSPRYMGCGPRDMTVDECVGSFRHIMSIYPCAYRVFIMEYDFIESRVRVFHYAG
jgi:hypothetical protein